MLIWFFASLFFWAGDDFGHHLGSEEFSEEISLRLFQHCNKNHRKSRQRFIFIMRLPFLKQKKCLIFIHNIP
jgi:hypothetical protein